MSDNRHGKIAFTFNNQLIKWNAKGLRPYKDNMVSKQGHILDNIVPTFITYKEFLYEWGLFILQFFAPSFIEFVSRQILLSNF